MAVGDEARRLQRPGHDGHGLPAHAQHHREKLVAELEPLVADAIVRHQQPSAAAFLDLMERVAGRGLHQLRDHCARVPSHKMRERFSPIEFPTKGSRGELQRGAVRHLHHRLARGGCSRGEIRFESNHPLAPDC